MKTLRPILPVLSLLALLATASCSEDVEMTDEMKKKEKALLEALEKCSPQAFPKAFSPELTSAKCFMDQKDFRSAENSLLSVGHVPEAQYQFGLLYMAGYTASCPVLDRAAPCSDRTEKPNETDIRFAHMWFNLARLNYSEKWRKKAVAQLNILEKKMSRAEIVEANDLRKRAGRMSPPGSTFRGYAPID